MIHFQQNSSVYEAGQEWIYNQSPEIAGFKKNNNKMVFWTCDDLESVSFSKCWVSHSPKFLLYKELLHIYMKQPHIF